jgi:hypothetical protein
MRRRAQQTMPPKQELAGIAAPRQAGAMRRLLAGLAGALLLVAGAPARAQEPAPEPETMRWYGYQSMVIDAAAISLALAGAAKTELCVFGTSPGQCTSNQVADIFWASSLVVYEFGGPTVHALHGHWPRPLYSAAARAAPLVGALLVSERAAPPILLFGVLGAMVLDDGFLAHERARPSSLALVPTVDPVRHERGLALAGRF